MYQLRISLSLLLVAALCATSVPAGDMGTKPAAASLKAVVERHLRDLGSDSRDVRVRAEQALLKLGPKVLPLLPSPELSSDVAVREAVRRVRVRLERRAAQESVKPSRVTLAGTRTLPSILQAVSQQTGNTIDLQNLPVELRRKRAEVKFQDATFWSVLEELSRRFGVSFEANRDGNALRPSLRTKRSSPRPLAVNTDAAFRVAVLKAEWKPLFGDDKHRLLRVTWSVTAEPRLRPLFLKFAAGNLQATAAGKGLAPFDPDARYEVPADEGAAAIRLHTDFSVPTALRVSRARFRGRLSVLTAAAEEPIEFRDLTAKGTAKRRGGVTVTLQDAGFTRDGLPSPETLAVEIAVSYDVGGPAFESHRTWIFHNRAWLQAPGGRRIRRLPGFKTTLQRDGAVAVKYRFRVPRASAKGLTFVYVAPMLLIDVPVSFDFAKVPLPQAAERTSP